ncbi:MAG: SCO family protein [Janthinobacterium lividum]
MGAGTGRGAPAASTGTLDARKQRRARLTLLLVIAICVAPVIASYFVYFVVRPHGGSTNYGALIDPQRPIPATLMMHTDAGASVPLSSLRGKWLLVSVDASQCAEACVKKLYFMRQVKATQGAERERVETVWLRTDDGGVPEVVRRAYPTTQMPVVDRQQLADWLPAAPNTRLEDHIYVVDPNGNLMMRFPSNPDPSKIKNDLTKLLKWSGIG